MNAPTDIAIAPRKRRIWFIALASGALVCLVVGVLLLGDWNLDKADPLFRGLPESAWIKNLKYSDDAQAKEWRAFGEEGVQVLIRGWERANRRGERVYRKAYRNVAPNLPRFLVRWLPAPKTDSTYQTRMCVASLLSRLGNDAKSAVPVMARALDDEQTGVRMIAISFFNSTEDEKCLLNQLPARERKKLLPKFIRPFQDLAYSEERNNAAIALKWYSEQREVVAPVLVKALQDPEPNVRLLAAEALGRVDPGAARKAAALAVVIAISKEPDDQIASRAVEALKYFPEEPEPAVRALIEGLDSTNSLVACQSVWSLEWAPEPYKRYGELVVPALQKAAARTNNAAGYAKVALKRWKSEASR